MAPAFLLLALAAAPISVSIAPLKVVNIEPKVGAFYTEHFTQQLSLQPGLKVISSEDIAAVIGMERQKELLGCADTNSSCLTELAGALGVEAIVSGSIAKVGSGYTLNLRAIAAKDARSLSVVSQRVTGGDDALLDALGAAAQQAGRDIKGTFAPAGTAVEVQLVREPPPLRGKAWIPAAVAVVGLVTGVTLLVLANNAANRISAGDRNIKSIPELNAAIAAGELQADLCVVAMSVGGAAAAATVIMFLLPGKEVPVSAWISRDSGGLTARWSFP